MKLYVVTRWVWGGRRDSDRDILGVFSTRERAEAMTVEAPSAEWDALRVTEVDLDVPVALTPAAPA